MYGICGNPHLGVVVASAFFLSEKDLRSKYTCQFTSVSVMHYSPIFSNCKMDITPYHKITYVSISVLFSLPQV